jgi:hypothetical protein
MLSAMKLPLATGFLSASPVAGAVSRSTASNGRYVLRVDRVFDPRSAPWLTVEEVNDGYQEGAPSDRWEVAIDGASVVLTELGGYSGSGYRLEGREEAAVDGERRYHLQADSFDDHGVLVVRGDEAELTLFARGPAKLSERGRLLSL